MSMDLYLWKAPVTDDPDEAGALLDRHLGGDETVFTPDPAIAAVAAELDRLYPWRWLSNEETVAAMSEEERRRYTPEDLKQVRHIEGGEPWSDLPFDQSDRLLILGIRWGTDNEVLDHIVRLGREHDLVIYDPQGPSVYLPDDPEEAESGPPEPLGPGAIIMAVCVTLLGALLIWAGWRLPVVVLNWLLIGLGVFVLGVGLTLLYAFVIEPLREPLK